MNQRCEAIIRVAVGFANSPKQMIEAVIDTGFTGFLALPPSTITALGLPWQFRDVGTLGDGSEVIFDMYKAIVIWDGQPQVIDVAASEADPLVGMSLLYGFKIQIEAVEGGTVTITTLE
ncbi:clan AA aspartic protease [Pantanalinema rosaneae CENA516]|uniref:clan AA aspartic protease n=1 Tax=Pantanalinema rosaneae TaxID=1620701 RepID=UPI003D6F8748